VSVCGTKELLGGLVLHLFPPSRPRSFFLSPFFKLSFIFVCSPSSVMYASTVLFSLAAVLSSFVAVNAEVHEVWVGGENGELQVCTISCFMIR